MTAMDLLDSLGGVRSDYVMAAQRYREGQKAGHRRSPLKIFLIAAAIIALLTGCAYAVMKLQDLKIGESPSGYHETSDLISMQGYVGSDSYMAVKEWTDFLESYDQEQTLFDEDAYARIQALDGYGNYLCYTQEMMDKLDEICEKYNMKLLGKKKQWTGDMESFFTVLGISGIMNDANQTKMILGAFYEDGSFEMTLESSLPKEIWPAPLQFQYKCVMKHTLDYQFLPVGDIAEYDQWEYVTKSGFPVMLAISHDKAILVANKSDCFVTVNLMNPTAGEAVYGQNEVTMDRKTMEAFAEMFDFSFTARPPEDSVMKEPDRQETTTAREDLAKYLDNFKQENYPDFAFSYLISHFPSNGSELLPEPYYMFYDINNDQIEELVIFRSGKIETIAVQDGNLVKCLQWMVNIKLCQEDILIEWYPLEVDNEEYYSIFKLEGENLVLIDAMRQNEEGWKKASKVSGSVVYETEISEQDVMEILNSYTPVDLKTLNLRPLKELAAEGGHT